MRRPHASVGWPGFLGLALLAAWVSWSVLVGIRLDQGISPTSPYVLAPVVLVAGVGAGQVLERYAADRRLHLALAFAGGVLVLGVLLTTEPGKRPLGYANANAALAVQVVALCGLALLATGRGQPGQRGERGECGERGERGERRTLMVALGLAVVAVALNRSAAGLAVCVPLVLVIGAVLGRRPVHRWWAVALGAVVAAAGAAVILRLGQGPGFPPWARGIFDTVREQLWSDAVTLWRTRPLTGSGPGSFQDATALAVDPDTSSAHSSVLQIGAETGWVGVAFLALTGLAGLLWAARGRAPEAVVAAAAWTALLVHSYADHLLEFAPVVLTAGMVIGWAAATRVSVPRPQKSSTSPSVSAQSPGAGGEAASGRVVSSGP
ncbi:MULTISPECIES: O-antigen ligase family protein [unclassified Knoellia]|uniref:O-antigen ligase family protein n=1 Tax=Knoellia altitudinis TaxID=3404795 RepID=UPI00361E5769